MNETWMKPIERAENVTVRQLTSVKPVKNRSVTSEASSSCTFQKFMLAFERWACPSIVFIQTEHVNFHQQRCRIGLWIATF